MPKRCCIRLALVAKDQYNRCPDGGNVVLWVIDMQLSFVQGALHNSAEDASLRLQLVPPEVKDTPEAPKQAREALQRMGPMSRDQIIMSATMAGAVVLWVLGDQLQIPAVTAAMLGLCSLLLTGVLKWRDCLEYSAVRTCRCSWSDGQDPDQMGPQS